MQNKGFTLIELLVVIAIIGILAGIIVVSMGGAQNSAQNAKIKATLDQMRSSAELYKIKNNVPSYAAYISTDEYLSLDDSVDDISSNDGFKVNGDGSKWCYVVDLLGTDAGTWCVDSAGYAGAATATGCSEPTGTTLAGCRVND